MFSQEENKREKLRVSDKKASTPHNIDPVLDYQNLKAEDKPQRRGFSSRGRKTQAKVEKVLKILPQSSVDTLISLSSAADKQRSKISTG